MSDENETDTTSIAIDKVRASKAGHAYHEAWAARSALELLHPATDLVAIALEGFDEADERDLGTGAVEIADLVRYHGARDIARASHVAIVQFKYSIASADRALRAADLAKTLTKFAVTDAELRTKHGDDHVDRVVRFEFATNRPIHVNLLAAVTAIVSGEKTQGDVARQAAQLATALKNYSHSHAGLLRRFDLVGSQGNLVDAERAVSATLAAWSEASDPDAEKRLLKLRNLIRIKAGPGSDADKTIDRVAVLAELDVEHEDRLYPTPNAFPDVADVIPRAVFEEVAELARLPGDPLVVHAAGGMGKTVLMQGLADRLIAAGPIVLFDGFGAGQWRNPSDGRHLPERTLVHLANLLAGKGLCDILLPVTDVTGLLRAFRRRLAQAVATARQTQDGALVSLVLDAVDHAGLAAQETGAPSFAHLLLRSIGIEPIEGVRVVASCRTERLAIATGDASCRTFAIPQFSEGEARDLIHRRVPDATAVEVAALIGRSGRNPRCLDNLIAAGRPFDPLVLPDTPGEAAALLDTLLRQRLERARAEARSRGATNTDIDLLLTGIALLVPPVPIDELAAAYGLDAAQIESFASDLAPLLERTAHGLMFRDEPTETLIRSTYGGAAADRRRIIAGLQARQSSSSYAARALPALLTSLRDADQLIGLAFDSRVPDGSSLVSARDIRLARITAAISLCAELGRRDDLFRLLLEASLVAAGHERSDRFLYEYPDLAAVAGDAEAQRRLAVTQVGWPGGKHAAQGIASSFAGDHDEARRHARRSIDWHNWALKAKTGNRFNDRAVSRDHDDIGFAYVEMLSGNDIRVANFLAQRGSGFAFRKFDDLFDLFERHRRSPHPPAMDLSRRLAHCRVPSRALYAAALRYWGDNPAVARRLIAQLGRADEAEKEESGPLAMAASLAIARAIDLGLEGDAGAIIGVAVHSSAPIHNYSSYYSVECTIDATVLGAGVRAALNRKPVTLLDIAPTELLALVPASAKARGPAAFERILNQKLAPPSPGGGRPRRKRRDGLDESRRSAYARTLSERIRPLLAFVQASADIVRPPSGQTRIDTVAAAFDALTATVERASTYPYRDGKAYVARIGFRVIFYLADALGALDAALTRRMADWVATAPGLYTADLIHVVARLSRVPAHHDAALLLAAQVERKIQLDTDVGTRVSTYGDLARAVWRVGIDEAAVYFRRALDLADAIGSDDFDRTNHLLELAGYYPGPELSPQAAHCLARILELNQGEDDRFPWIEYAQAMVPIAGSAMLATLGRLDDRSAAQLGLSLGPALSELVRAGKLSSDSAAALCGLSAPVESWTWHFSDVAAAIAERLAPERLEWFFQLVLVEIDRNDQLLPPQQTIEGLNRLAEVHLPIASPSRTRIAALLARRGPPAALPLPPAPATDAPTPYPVDLTDPDQIDREILGQAVDHAGRRWAVSTLRTLALQPATPAARLDFVRAVVGSSAATLAEKLHALDDHLLAWAAASPAMRDALPALGLRLAAKHALELANSSWDALAGWRDLVKYFGSDLALLVEQVISALRANADNLGGNAWLALAAKLARAASPAAIAEGLERFLSLTDAKLPAEVGDGPWTPSFVVPSDENALVAGLIWSRLGHSGAAMRWRAAHAVRRFAALGRFEVIDYLVILAETDSALPFVDAKLPFYVLHARLWLLIALARIAKDDASPLVRHRDYLERVAFSTNFPHVVMREFALMALRAIAPLLDPAGRDALTARLATVNRSPWPHAPRADYTEFRYLPRPDGSPRADHAFSLDYDFRKYQVESLCHVFSCPVWQVEDRINVVVRGWDSTIRGMYEDARSDGIDRSWSSGYMPKSDQYGGYLGWHALMLVAGDLIATQPVVGEHWDGDAWMAFLKDYLVSRDDGLWLADLTDLFPLDLPKPHELAMPDSETASLAKDRPLLSPLLGLAGDTLASDWLPVSARWSLDRDTTLTIHSVIANSGDARSTVMTLLSDEPFFRWLPDDEDEIACHFGRADHSVQAWVSKTPNTQRKLDRYDPYAASTALDRPFPAEWMRAEQSIAADDVIVRSWSCDGVPAYRAEAWGAEGGVGEHSWGETGYRLSIRRDALIDRLALSGKSLVLALKLQKHHKGKSTGQLGDTSSFTHRSMILVVNERSVVWLPQRLSKQARAALATLEPDSRHDFYHRFRAIAGLTDERVAQHTARTPFDGDAFRIIIEGPDLDL
ncbi:hypothetical protein [Azospirillum sp. Marseille-Q6669]